MYVYIGMFIYIHVIILYIHICMYTFIYLYIFMDIQLIKDKQTKSISLLLIVWCYQNNPQKINELYINEKKFWETW